jgi:hypothetical protein
MRAAAAHHEHLAQRFEDMADLWAHRGDERRANLFREEARLARQAAHAKTKQARKTRAA